MEKLDSGRRGLAEGEPRILDTVEGKQLLVLEWRAKGSKPSYLTAVSGPEVSIETLCRAPFAPRCMQ